MSSDCLMTIANRSCICTTLLQHQSKAAEGMIPGLSVCMSTAKQIQLSYFLKNFPKNLPYCDQQWHTIPRSSQIVSRESFSLYTTTPHAHCSRPSLPASYFHKERKYAGWHTEVGCDFKQVSMTSQRRPVICESMD